MANRALQTGNTLIAYNDENYSLSDEYGSSAGYFIVKNSASEPVVTIYSEGFLKWDIPPPEENITISGMLTKIWLP